MAYGRDYPRRGGRARRPHPAAYGGEYESPWYGAGQGRDFPPGYGGGTLRSRGSYQQGARRSGPERDEFEWGGGYVGGRGYGGTNFDYEHGYRTAVARVSGASQRAPGVGEAAQRDRDRGTSASTRGGYEWGEEVSARTGEPYGPARYGLGPYYQRVQRSRRHDDEIREEVEESLFYDTWVDADAITVTVADGVVTLEGTLPNYEEIRFATEDAWDVDGVRGVRTELRVEGQPRRSGRSASRERDDRAEEERGERRDARGSGNQETGPEKPQDDTGRDAQETPEARAPRARASGRAQQPKGSGASKSRGRASNATEGRGEASGLAGSDRQE